LTLFGVECFAKFVILNKKDPEIGKPDGSHGRGCCYDRANTPEGDLFFYQGEEAAAHGFLF